MLEKEQEIILNEGNEGNVGMPEKVILRIDRTYLFVRSIFGMDPAELTDLMNTARQQLNEEQNHTLH